MTRHTIVVNGKGMTRAGMLLSEKGVLSKGTLSQGAGKEIGGWSVKDYQPPRQGERHLPLANYAGPGTQIYRRLGENVQPTTVSDAGARIHDSEYYSIGRQLALGRITKAQAEMLARKSDLKLIAATKKAPSGPVETPMALAVRTGIQAKNRLEDAGLMSRSKYITGSNPVKATDPELPAPFNSTGGKKPRAPRKKKVDLLKGLKKRIQKEARV